MSGITEIRAQRRGSKRRLISVDGEPWRCVSSEVIAAAGVVEGDDIDRAALSASFAELEPLVAKERALRLLAFKDRSRSGLIERLVEDGYPCEVAEGAVADLERLGFVDDDRYAAAHARTLVEIRHFGRSRAVRELQRAGIAADVAVAAVAEALPPDAEQDTALALARAAARRSGANVDKIAARLVRRGYRPADALKAARSALGDFGDEGSDDRVWGAR